MDLLAALHAYLRVTESGSFSAVARELGTTQPAISRQVAALEEHLGVRLLQRTTRSLALTEDGEALLDQARQVLDAVEAVEGNFGRRRTSPAGLVRLATPAVFGRMHVVPRMPRLFALYPDISVELHVSDLRHDLVADGIDLALRAAPVADSTLVSRRLGSARRSVVGSADYLARRGEPAHPDALAAHDCIVSTRPGEQHVWAFSGADGDAAVPIVGRFGADSGEALRAAVLSGLGLASVPLWYFTDAELEAGLVRPVLQAWQMPRVDLALVYPTRRHLPPRTRAVLDFLVDELGSEPALR